MSKKEMFAPTAVLVCICLVASLLLSVTYQVTLPQIEAIAVKNANASRAEVLAAADEFTQITDAEFYDGVTEVYKAKNGAGYVITCVSKGFGGDVTVMTGIDSTGKISKVKVTSAADETPGLGQKATLPAYTDQYTGAEKLTNDKTDGSATYIQAVTGASYSSRAVFSCVSTALLQYLELGGAY